ncbi:MAG: hypothetical protein IKH48_04405 [Prevotella sp.]|nr:hypothetical protein [Prevotella sp.]
MPQPDLQELFQRLEHLERKCHRMEARIAELEAQMAEKQAIPEQETTVEVEENAVGIGENASPEPSPITHHPTPITHHPSPNTQHPSPTTQHLFLAAPTPDGVFLQASETEQIGKSIYQLTTTDGQNGTFILLDTPDAIATAMISVSQFVKPACKVSGNTALQPRHIITEEEGAASREGTGWKITRKAVVRFE